MRKDKSRLVCWTLEFNPQKKKLKKTHTQKKKRLEMERRKRSRRVGVPETRTTTTWGVRLKGPFCPRFACGPVETSLADGLTEEGEKRGEDRAVTRDTKLPRHTHTTFSATINTVLGVSLRLSGVCISMLFFFFQGGTFGVLMGSYGLIFIYRLRGNRTFFFFCFFFYFNKFFSRCPSNCHQAD